MRVDPSRIYVLTVMVMVAVGCDSKLLWTASGIPSAFEKDDVLMRAGAGQGIRLMACGGGVSRGGGTEEVDRHCDAIIATGTKDQLLHALQSETKRTIETEGGTICGHGESTSGDLIAFSFDYERPRSRGIVRVQSFADSNGQIKIVLMVYEHPL
ncbi:MAG TPA: hypothetical protein VFG04_13480 [Planctomycetaceae bacterium]|jgi:hypothetical protein|nr:hypothetical protein [Planctomycetaceae bacterium]